MSLLIPVAKNKTGETVTPTCNKEEGPFACLGCAKPLVLRQGERNQWHFAHHSNNDDECSAGGETYIHLAAKLLLVTYITRFEFASKCGRLRHDHEKQYQGCTAVQEYRYDGVHSADVAVLRDGNLEAIIEVMVTHKTEGEPLASRIERVGGDNVWEVEAMDVWRQRKRLSLTTDTIHVSSLLKLEDCAECARERREAHERREKLMAIEQKKSEAYSQQYTARQNTTVVIIDDNTIRRNGVLMKKFFYKP
ncbi:unnamed protein product, partial [Ectocarpus sp. 8 AP-2014]